MLVSGAKPDNQAIPLIEVGRGRHATPGRCVARVKLARSAHNEEKAVKNNETSRPDAMPTGRVRKIATEEACSIPEVAAALRDVARRGGESLDLKLVGGLYDVDES